LFFLTGSHSNSGRRKKANRKLKQKRGKEMRKLLALGLLIALCIVTSPVWAAEITTDRGEYSPGEMVYISGSGFTIGSEITITLTVTADAVYAPYSWTVGSSDGTFLTTYVVGPGAATYVVNAIDTAGIEAETTFYDPVNIVFATSGLPAGQSLTISYSGTNNGNQPIAGSKTFNSPGPSTPAIGTAPNTPFTYSGFPSSITIGSDTYTLISTSPGSSFNTGSSGSPTPSTTVIATYVLATTPLSITAPADVTLEGNTTGGFSGDIGTATASGGTTPYTITNNAPDPIPLGTNTVTWTVTDGNSDTATDDQIVTVVDTTPPTITAPANVNVEGNAVGGANVVLADLNGPATATDIVDPSPTVTSDFVTGFYALGSTTTVTWNATDASGNFATATQTFTIVDTTPPTITVPSALTVLVNAPSSVLTGSVSDIVDDNPSLTNDAPATFPPGITTVTWTAMDASGNTAHATTVVTANYNVIGLGFLQPIDMDGSSIFKLGSTVPTKFQLTDYYGNYVSTAVANLKTAKISNSVLGDEVEAVSTSAATTGSLFRYDATANQYIFNLGTKTLSKGAYQITAYLDSGQTIQVVISLK
jgi:hypothetical protein